MSTVSFWLDEPTEPLSRVVLDGPADVAVVGGGITGCACALALADAGKRVRLFEAREIAGGASGRNGGFALRGGAAAYPVLVESIGAEATASIWRWTETELAALAALAGDAFRHTGSLRLAADDEERDELREEYEALAERRRPVSRSTSTHASLLSMQHAPRWSWSQPTAIRVACSGSSKASSSRRAVR